ncbi:hypothetical protein HY772_01830 [Candidatus Woesearchaeota archaeon]|nr:hypothetical protein [Candidatus Woesearchaeota archaeon]
MVETIGQARQSGVRDIPPLGPVKAVTYAPEWQKLYGYPTNKIPIADYYVTYQYTKDFGSCWLIEASVSRLHLQIKQLIASADFFKRREISVDGYAVVLDHLSPRDKQKYALKSATPQPFKHVFERLDQQHEKQQFICSKPIFVIFRRDFERLRK